MSRIGIRPVIIPEGVQVELEPTAITVRGGASTQSVAVPYGIKVTQKADSLIVDRLSEAKQVKSYHGTVRALLQNAVQGVSKGFEKRLELVGIGYRAAVEGDKLNLQVGFTHPVLMQIPEGITVKVEKNVIIVNGSDKQRLGQFCAEVRAVRKPEPYKGKGIRYQGEKVRMKQGKATKAG